jgi:hypothetical protein
LGGRSTTRFLRHSTLYTIHIILLQRVATVAICEKWMCCYMKTKGDPMLFISLYVSGRLVSLCDLVEF